MKNQNQNNFPLEEQANELRQFLLKRLRKNNEEMTPVFIQEVVVYAADSYGEAKSAAIDKSTIDDPAPRLLAHIALLAELTNSIHQNSYCTLAENGEHVLKDDCLNKITRLSLNEFSLYTNQPLSQQQFKIICAGIEQISKKLLDNVHLLLSSFAVVNEQNEILNTALYVEGGLISKTRVISKSFASTVDVTYEQMKNFSQGVCYGGMKSLSDFVAGDNAATIPVTNSNFFEVRTKGNAVYLQSLELCLDHRFKRVKDSLISKLTRSSSDSQLLPKYVDQIISSNSISIHDDSLIVPLAWHVDPNYMNPIPLSLLNLDSGLLSAIQARQHPTLQLKNEGKLLQIINPAFGRDAILIRHNERQLTGFLPEILLLVEFENQKIIEERVDTLLINNSKDIELIRQCIEQKNADLFASIFQKYPKVNYVALIEQLAHKFDSAEKPQVKKWLYQEVMRNELKKNIYLNMETIMSAIQNGVDFNHRFNETSTFGENTFAYACVFQNPRLVSAFYEKNPHVNYIQAVENTVLQFSPSSQAFAKKWLYQEILTCEFEKEDGGDLAVILAALRAGINFFHPYKYALNLGERALLQAYICKEPRILQEISMQNPNLNYFAVIENALKDFSPLVKTMLRVWFYQEFLKIELKKTVNVNMELVLGLLAEELDFFEPYDQVLYLGEQALAQAFLCKDTNIISVMKAKYPNVDYAMVIPRIANSFGKFFATEVAHWLSQEIMKSNLLQIQFGIACQDEAQLLQQTMSLYQIYIQAMNVNSQKQTLETLCEAICTLIIRYRKYGDTDAAALIAQFTRVFDASLQARVKYRLCHEIIKDELKKTANADRVLLQTIVQLGIDFYYPYQGNSCIGEELIALVFTVRDSQLLATLMNHFSQVNWFTIVQKIGSQLVSPLGEEIKNWFAHEIILMELQKGRQADANRLRQALQFGINFFHPYCNTCLGVQLMAQACVSQDTELLRKIYTAYPRVDYAAMISHAVGLFDANAQNSANNWLWQMFTELNQNEPQGLHHYRFFHEPRGAFDGENSKNDMKSCTI
ncbi:hypothetical protein [Legionella septentrionalis]|uniref:Uncharacterized protein n=1 Tax=Legionella septentrionalis TaxID=2498109 RepID=A0A433JIY4_9GAMM|nr:hypothetical protein [Legionella septentrionalis]RUQ85328.1 hypothetical protein EKM59_06725 [Legionella septentrionalis]RUR15377.1 hypothetical protein ELY10_06130 [Legionella septentrionalis]